MREIIFCVIFYATAVVGKEGNVTLQFVIQMFQEVFFHFSASVPQ